MNSETRTFLLLETMYKFREQVSKPQLATFVALAQLTSGFCFSFFFFFFFSFFSWRRIPRKLNKKQNSQLSAIPFSKSLFLAFWILFFLSSSGITARLMCASTISYLQIRFVVLAYCTCRPRLFLSRLLRSQPTYKSI